MGLDPKKPVDRVLKNIEISFKWMILVWFVAFGGIRRRRDRFDPRKIRRVLFVRHDKLGDMIISLPIFHNLKRVFPEMEIDVLCGRDNSMVIEHDPNISNIVYYKKKPIADFARIKEMRERRYDAIVDLIFGDSVTTTILMSLIGPGSYKLAAGKSILAQFFDRSLRGAAVKGLHIIQTTGSVLRLFDIAPEECNMIPRMYLVDDDERKAKEFLAPLRQEHEMLICINLSAGRPARTWPVEKYIELMGMLIPKFSNAGFVLSAAPSERNKIDRVMSAHNERVYRVPDGYSIREIAGLLKNVDFLITPDTSIGHIASCVDLPTLAMYPGNMENFEVWRPFNPKVRAINSPDYYRIEYLDSKPVFDAFCRIVAEENPRYAE